MRHKVTRLFLDFEKEEKWLNEMAAKGYQFISYCVPQYLFEEGEPGEYTYRIELMDNLPSHIEGQAYIKFVEETGAECVDTYWRWAYFRRRSTDGPFDLYTDLPSRLKHYQRIMTLIGTIAIIEFAIAVFGVMNYQHEMLAPVSIGVVFTAIFAKLFMSYWRRASKLKREMALRE